MSFFARLLVAGRPRKDRTPFEAGVAALDARHFDEALAQFARALEEASADAERPAIHNKRGIVHLHRADRAAAIDAFVDALEIDPQFVPTIVNVGNMLFEDGALDEAIVHYEAALRIDDAYSVAHLNLGIAYKKLGRRGDAVREFRHANRLDVRLRRGRT